ncbi:MAG TPA: NAD(P)-dependent oxidoreductase, partial [Sphingomonadaceae bacterium]|nr:NAD(P)-dependent oxidoreductase [Sphingomonadaceae bacterium]
LVAAGYEVIAYDPDERALDAFKAAGGRAAGSAAEVGAVATIAFLSLPTPSVVKDVATGVRGLLSGAPVTEVIVDLSTSGPATAKEVAEALAARGVAFVDSPVSGGRAGALAGRLAMMVAGARPAVGRVQPILEHLGKVFNVGQAPGDAQTMKLLNNLLSVVALAASSEVLAVGVKAGLDPQVMLDVINASSGRNSATVDKIPRFVLPRTFDFGFATALSVKDIKLCLDEAAALGVPMLVGAAAQTMLGIAHASFGPQSDLTCIARVAEQWAGVEIGAGSAAQAVE